MGGLTNKVNELNNSYAEVSIEKMKVLCRIAGVAYRSPKQARLLAEDLWEQGFKIQVLKFSAEDEAVGQSLLLRDLEDSFIRGYRVWIDFKDNYKVKVADLYSEDDYAWFNGGK